MNLILKLVNGETLEQTVTTNVCVIGRSAKCDVVVPHEGMSRQHCQIDLIDGEVFITDLGSTNGVLIDGVKIEPHKKTPYATYLTLSFGAVQNLQIELEEPGGSIAAKTQGPRREISHQQSGTSITSMTKTKVMNESSKTSPSAASVRAPKSKVKENKLQSMMVNILALIILAGAVWWYMSQDEETAAPIIEESTVTPAEKSEKAYETF